jgi:uncharacterized protein YgiM (DUF1202 family)
MKMNYWLFLGAMLSTSLLAQQATNPTPSAPISTPEAAPAASMTPAADATNAPAAKSAKKKAAKKKSAQSSQKKAATKKAEATAELKTVPLVPGPAVVVASNVNVRGQAKLKSEVVTRITKGQSVTVLEEIVRNDSGPEEPSAWAKILLPLGAHTWVNTAFIDSTNKTVRPKKLNLRSGPGENYSVLGLMMRGDPVKELNTKGDWTEIEPPAGAYAFVAAQFLKQGAEAPIVAAAPPPTTPTPSPVTPVPPPEPPLQPATVASAPVVAPPPMQAPTTPAPAPVAPPPVEVPAPAPTPAIATPAETAAPEEPPPPRIVQREGIVRGMTSIQAPSRFVLINPEDRRDMDYLYSDSPNLDLRRYKGLRIIVTGEEGLDERWPNTPVLTIQKIQLVEEASPSAAK